MKNYIKNIALGLVIASSLTACDDFLTIDPEDKLVQETFFTSADMVRANTLCLYNHYTWSNWTMGAMWKLDMINGDIFYTYDQEGQWFFGNYTATNQFIGEGWKGLYNVILFANSVINDMPANCSGSVTQDDIDKAVAEARCIRAYCYYVLTELWHDVPIIDNNTGDITANNTNKPRNFQKDVYRFCLEDLNYAVETLPDSDSDVFRCTKSTARAIRAKLLVTMAAHNDYGYDRDAYYRQAAADAKAVMETRSWLTSIKFDNLFDVEANNGEESILALQCGVLGYAYGNNRNVNWSRSSVIADQTWGAAKCPTIAIQTIFKEYPADKRRYWTYMQQGDYYSMLNKAGGGYTYNIVSYNDDGSVLEDRNECNAHIKKYILGKSADCNGQVGLNQDAGNNLYLIRLADMYLTYAEAAMGTASSTTDADALMYFNAVRERAGIATVTSLTYEELMKERIREFLFESQTWFDSQRLRYREGDAAALDWLNTGFHTGYNRCSQFNLRYGLDGNDPTITQDPNSYDIVTNKAEWAQYDPIMLTSDSFVSPLPAEATTTAPALLGDVVSFYDDAE
ncbi:MAG: RagB/SusD family nutrient uptake outer membrane protein [Bacteroidales bacterium]|nr:RagB/SusD family nutrient uptake outer membrane protein [Bacteroidales bacterium]